MINNSSVKIIRVLITRSAVSNSLAFPFICTAMFIFLALIETLYFKQDLNVILEQSRFDRSSGRDV